MITIDDDASNYFRDKLTATQAVRVFFGGYG
jgi:hypothetical protein